MVVGVFFVYTTSERDSISVSGGWLSDLFKKCA